MEFFQTLITGQHDLDIASNAYLLCESAHEKQIFKNSKRGSLSKLIKNINLDLNESEKKNAAIAQLLTLLPQCDNQTYSLEGERWLRLCLQKLKNNDGVVVRQLLAIITFLLRNCRHNKDLMYQVQKLNGQFLPQIYSVESEFKSDVYKCLLQFLLIFPQQVLPHKTNIEKLIVQSLMQPLGSNDACVTYAAKVFVTLPIPGLAKMDFGQLRRGRFEQLISLGHCAMDIIFKGIQENETYSFTREHKLPIMGLDSALSVTEPLRSIFTATSILSNCFIFIREFFRTINVDYSPRELLRFVIRSLQVEYGMLNSSAMENAIVGLVLPSIHLRALELMKCLVQNNVFGVYSILVEEQVMMSLRESYRTVQAGKRKPQNEANLQQKNIYIKSLCYQTLAEIVRCSKGCHRATVEGIISSLINDIHPNKSHAFSLKRATRGARLNAVTARKKSKKKGYTVAAEEMEEDVGFDSPDTTSRLFPITLGALNLIEALFLHAQDALSLKIVRSLNKHLVDILNYPKVGVYSVPEVKIGLYSAVIAYALYPHPLCPPSYSALHQALGEGAADSNSLVSLTCLRGLATLSFATANPSVGEMSHVMNSIPLNEENEMEEEMEVHREDLQNGECSDHDSDVSVSHSDMEENMGHHSINHLSLKKNPGKLIAKQLKNNNEKMPPQEDFLNLNFTRDDDNLTEGVGDENGAGMEGEESIEENDDDVEKANVEEETDKNEASIGENGTCSIASSEDEDEESKDDEDDVEEIKDDGGDVEESKEDGDDELVEVLDESASDKDKDSPEEESEEQIEIDDPLSSDSLEIMDPVPEKETPCRKRNKTAPKRSRKELKKSKKSDMNEVPLSEMLGAFVDLDSD